MDFNRKATVRSLTVLLGALLLYIGHRMGIVLDIKSPVGSPENLIIAWIFYLFGFILIFGSVTSFDVEKWNKKLAYLFTFGLTFGLLFFYNTDAGLGTDGMLFTRYSAELLLNGYNPYANSMLPAFDQFSMGTAFATYNVEGGIVHSLSYPAMSFLPYMPQVAMGIANPNLTTVIIYMLTLGFLVYESPKELAFLPILVMLINPNLLFYSNGGVFDILWVLPLLIGIKFWYSGRQKLSAFIIGIGFAVKQTPWLLAPFMAIWLYMMSDSYRESIVRIVKVGGSGLIGFLLPNIPFLFWNPIMWLKGIFTPIGSKAALVIQGSGFALLDSAGILGLSKTFFVVAVLGAYAFSLFVYALYFDRMEKMFWLSPAFLLFFHYRSLQNYFIFFVPVAYYLILIKTNSISQTSWRDYVPTNRFIE